MPSDIVTRLRKCTCVPHGEICREAADEIAQLRTHLLGNHGRIEEQYAIMDELCKRIHALTAERDEAQRKVSNER